MDLFSEYPNKTQIDMKRELIHILNQTHNTDTIHEKLIELEYFLSIFNKNEIIWMENDNKNKIMDSIRTIYDIINTNRDYMELRFHDKFSLRLTDDEKQKIKSALQTMYIHDIETWNNENENAEYRECYDSVNDFFIDDIDNGEFCEMFDFLDGYKRESKRYNAYKNFDSIVSNYVESIKYEIIK